jgi:hypothetical protein
MATMISEVYDAFRSVGVPEDKARAAAEALSEEQLATKADIARLEKVTTSEIAKLEGATKADIARLEKVATSEIAKLEGATKADIARLEKVTTSEIAKLEKTTTSEIAKLEASTRADSARVERELLVVKWMLGLVIVSVVVPLIRPFFG